MAWEVRFFTEGHALDEAAHGAPCRFQAEADALTPPAPRDPVAERRAAERTPAPGVCATTCVPPA